MLEAHVRHVNTAQTRHKIRELVLNINIKQIDMFNTKFKCVRRGLSTG